MFMDVYITCAWTCVRTCVWKKYYMRVHVCAYMCMDMYITCAWTCVRTCLWKEILHTCASVCVYVYGHVYDMCMDLCAYICMDTYMTCAWTCMLRCAWTCRDAWLSESTGEPGTPWPCVDVCQPLANPAGLGLRTCV